MTETIKVVCPVCQSMVLWNEEYPYRPFCSQRCKQIDFGDWATEAHVIKGSQSNLDEFDEFSLDEAGIPPESQNPAD